MSDTIENSLASSSSGRTPDMDVALGPVIRSEFLAGREDVEAGYQIMGINHPVRVPIPSRTGELPTTARERRLSLIISRTDSSVLLDLLVQFGVFGERLPIGRRLKSLSQHEGRERQYGGEALL